MGFRLPDNLTPYVAKAGGSQSQDAKGEAVTLYCDPLATPDLASSGFPGRMKKQMPIMLFEIL